MPRFLSVRPTRTHAAESEAAEASADRAAQDWTGSSTSRISTGSHSFAPVSGATARDLVRLAGPGETLPARLHRETELRYGIDADQVRVHADARGDRVARAYGANAVTAGGDIFFARGRYAPETRDGEHLLAHELAHVAQQGAEPLAVQCDLARSIGVTLGAFDVDLAIQAATPASNAGMMGTIGFLPDPNGPYSAEIGLVQAVKVTDVAGATSGVPGSPLDWANDVPGGANPEAARNELGTTGLGAAPPGWFIDSSTATQPRGSAIGPNYIEHFFSPPPANQFGWLRSPTDFGPASLWDFPNSPHDTNFDFETVAKGTDNQTVYGSLFWGFRIRSNAVAPGSDYAFARDTTTPVFEEALERSRGFYVHEPVVLYFDTNDPFPRTGEELKLADVSDYLRRYPDVTVQIDGFADVRGTAAYNLKLAQQRADAAANLLTLQGVDAGRIDPSGVIGWGETQEFSQHGTAPGATQPITPGRLQANRRVVIRFTHSVSGYPIVMP